MNLWLVDYLNPHTELTDCLVIEAESKDDAEEHAINELKLLDIPKRYILNLEKF